MKMNISLPVEIDIPDCVIEEIRNKAIDDFLKNLYKIGERRDFDWEDMYNLAEQLKAGGTDEMEK